MTLADEYLDAIQSADLPRMLALFADDAQVHSPLYGLVRAAAFYPMLFAETDRAVPTLRRVFTDSTEAIAFWFDYQWTLTDGETATVNAVDVVEVNADGLIEQIYIIYDTRALGTAFTAQASKDP